MMRRLFWVGVGAAVAIVAVRKFSATTQRYSASGLVGQAGSFADKLTSTVRELGSDIRDGMAEREQELTSALAGESHGPGVNRTGSTGRSRHDVGDEPLYEF